MADYIKLAEAPRFVYRNPYCGSCVVDLDGDSDGWTCPVCGSSWGHDSGDGDKGELYESWAGEELDGEPLDEDAACVAGAVHERTERLASYKRWGWCEHGMSGECAWARCAGGKSARVLAGKESDR